jgi:hypothetical protein
MACGAARGGIARRRRARASDLARHRYSNSASGSDLQEYEEQLASRGEVRDERLAKEGLAEPHEIAGDGLARRIGDE